MTDEMERTGIVNEDDWNDKNVNDVREKGREADMFTKYRASKVLAEKGRR